MQIADHIFLVTGGGSGLGAACARRFVAGGGRVVIADVQKASGEALATELGSKARFVETDVTNRGSAERCVEAAVREFGELHGLVNCAGIALAERAVGKEGPHRLESFSRVIGVNLIGTFNMIAVASATMSKGEPSPVGERGVIVNTASVAAFDGQIGQAAYSASKAGVVGLTLPVARELARFGIRVMTIAPGIFETPMLGQLSEEIRKSLGQQVPFPARLGRADEFATLAAHIVENEMLNGETIRLDGAIRMAPK
ncbi:MAG TPA: 3-hydroxyacyl-CoA dehydrogenase [Planctomycetaceae bacterium]|jgi:NAD(P)-dependent dehydrogenase (short-subunit alcohol dehydrogenase family)|nr:3-hydroxyacyl-CoA dehydrogenase [Planctomycetaceae bacterium]